MSLGSALNASVSGLRAQSAALSAVSENIANASTTAYKKREISFESLITSSSAATSVNQVGGGVTFGTSQRITEQGLVQNTGRVENIAINGLGFFVVTDDITNQPSGYTYTRNGDFRTDEAGLVINNEGMVLLGQRTDINGLVTAANANDLNSLVPVDFGTVSGTAGATTLASMELNLPAESGIYVAGVGPEYVTALEVFDDLGVGHTIGVTFRKTAVNTWDMIYANPYQTALGPASPQTGFLDVDPGTAGVQLTRTLTFNGDGSVNQIDGAAAGTFTVTMDDGVAGAGGAGNPLTTGANPLSFTLDLGTTTLFDGITQFASNSSTPDMSITTIEQDGVRFGQLAGVEIDDDGLVTALFDNGVRRPIYQIPIATFPNPEGLTNIKGTVYDENENAGNFNLRQPGEGSAGSIVPTSLELSTVDQSDEFNKMIVAQQAYSSAAQILSTVDDMFETLIGAVR